MALTSKELSWIEDQMNLEQIMIKKYASLESMATDSVVKMQIKNAADRHKQHFNKLMEHLN